MSDFAAGSNVFRVVRASESLDVARGNEGFSADPARGQLSFRDQVVHGSNADAQRGGRIFARVKKLLNLVIHNPSFQQQESDPSGWSGVRVPEFHPECPGRYKAIPEFGQFEAVALPSWGSIRGVWVVREICTCFSDKDAPTVVTLPRELSDQV